MRRFRRYFLTGLLTLLPIWLVWIVFKFLLVLLSDLSRSWGRRWPGRMPSGSPAPWAGVKNPWRQPRFALRATAISTAAVGALAGPGAGQRPWAGSRT